MIIIDEDGIMYDVVPTKVLEQIRDEINTPNRGTCDYFIVDRIEEIINKYMSDKEQNGRIRNDTNK